MKDIEKYPHDQSQVNSICLKRSSRFFLNEWKPKPGNAFGDGTFSIVLSWMTMSVVRYIERHRMQAQNKSESSIPTLIIE